ncbi:isoprenyl transferase [Lacticigenium naphthae]|uniref:isoprenyl transferase n=1 Tax=Lacticigenium naphthae TaxID=515351 RepID=UPI00041ADAAE|nr:isoprenyl transferase [Lacticigenium naphthae]
MDNSTKELTLENIPNHVAIIMDGNGRWAKNKNLPRTKGHQEGMDAVRRVAIRASKRGIRVLTLYAFSTENWKRPIEEVRFLMQLPSQFFNTFMPEIQKNNIQVQVTGFTQKLPITTRRAVNRAVKETQDNDGMILNFALNYGGRAEIVFATKKIAQAVIDGTIKTDDITEELIESSLQTSMLGEYQNVDLLIRSSGEQRLSNFLLWQNAYSEFYFSVTKWPDYDGDSLDEALLEFQKRQRRFGSVQ